MMFLSASCFCHSLHFILPFLQQQFSFVALVATSVIIMSSLVTFFLFSLYIIDNHCFTEFPYVFSVVIFWKIFDFYCFFVHLFPKMGFLVQNFNLVELNFMTAVFDMFSYCKELPLFGNPRLVHVLLSLFRLFFLFAQCMICHMNKVFHKRMGFAYLVIYP